MSRKTKRQKIMSSYRRKLQRLTQLKEPNREKVVIPSPQVSLPFYQEEPMSKVTRNAALHDLKKTGIITTIILLIEFLIYYANLMGIIKI